jgi:hypothetical protein
LYNRQIECAKNILPNHHVPGEIGRRKDSNVQSLEDVVSILTDYILAEILNIGQPILFRMAACCQFFRINESNIISIMLDSLIKFLILIFWIIESSNLKEKSDLLT